MRRRLAGVSLVLLGVAGVATAGWAYFDAWSTSQAWNASPQAAALARQVSEPTPIWLPEATPGPILASQPIQPLPTRGLDALLVPTPGPVATPTIVVAAEELSLDATDFRFLDPPEPDAHARLAVTVANHAAAPSGRVLLGIPASWFQDYRVVGTAPAVSDDRTDDAGLRTFSFPSIGPGSSADFELHVTAIGEGTQAPAVKVLLAGGDVIAEDRPATLAPTPRPGPVMSIDIPSLKLHSGVVQIAWEPPPFAVGQLNGSANVTLGNTVLVGHLTGAAGNVFAHLDQLKLGDEITTVSRGQPYAFVVSSTFESTNTDFSPLLPADDARLTLMTCAGVWNPFTHDYSKRKWVVAEAPERAAVTIAAAAATATAEAEAAVAATATAVALEPTMTPTPVFTGEPSLAGGIGNSRADLEKALGRATGETSGKLVVFRQPGRELHVVFTPDPPRAALLAEIFGSGNRMSLDAAVREARKLLPTDTLPRADAPEGNSQFVVERFTSPGLAQALGSGDFSVVYTHDATGAITSILLGLGDDFEALIQQSRR
ncbi:MAG: sortase [Chloroflexota bacterium]|nr:sortase [Chloroflexota bacterium]